MNPQFGMGMNFGMPNMPMNMGIQGGNVFMGMNNNMMMDNSANEEWMKGFQMGVDEVSGSQQEENIGGLKINIIFRTTQGTTTNMIYPYGTTLDQAIAKYLARVGREDLYRDKSHQICFLFNGSQIKFGDNRKVEVFFKNIAGPKVIVNDVHNLIGA